MEGGTKPSDGLRRRRTLSSIELTLTTPGAGAGVDCLNPASLTSLVSHDETCSVATVTGGQRRAAHEAGASLACAVVKRDSVTEALIKTAMACLVAVPTGSGVVEASTAGATGRLLLPLEAKVNAACALVETFYHKGLLGVVSSLFSAELLDTARYFCQWAKLSAKCELAHEEIELMHSLSALRRQQMLKQ
ncbi:unnamed protein product, partial [Protopolystoma xenopodis]